MYLRSLPRRAGSPLLAEIAGGDAAQSRAVPSPTLSSLPCHIVDLQCDVVDCPAA